MGEGGGEILSVLLVFESIAIPVGPLIAEIGEVFFLKAFARKRKLDDAGASEINRLYLESRRKVEKERPISEFTPPAGGGWRKRAADEDETKVTSRGREGKSAGREGFTAPKRVQGAPKTQWEGECCFFCSRNKKKRVYKEKLTDATAGGTKLEPAFTLIPVLMRGTCV
ncbi:hypothetical protein TNCV_3474951 [Trichonephila clavipes]|nr:hypothetical protein TNCV_3474951 [Trichonephila clavipes]